MSPPALSVIVGLLAIFLGLLPLGAVLLRLFERWLGRRLALTPVERVVGALYASGGLLFVVASIPVPWFGPPLVLALVALGVGGLLLAWHRETWAPAHTLTRWATTYAGLALILGTLGLFVLEVVSTGTRTFPNSNDGSFQSLYIQLLSTRHTLAWTMLPYQDSGITYPGGATVWLSLPVILYGWAAPSGPVSVPLFFLSFSVVGAFCWGERLGGANTEVGSRTGLLFAGFFGLVGSWPRLYVGGSYDFAICLPLLLMTFGLLRPFVERGSPGWKEAVGFGLLLGVSTALSALIGELLFFLLVAFVLVFAYRSRTSGFRWLGTLGLVVTLGLAFVLRSLVGLAVWFSYPGHVLSAVGNPPYASTGVGYLPFSFSFASDLDPFLPWKPKVSPLPWLSVEITVLTLVGGLLLLAWVLLPGRPLRRWLPANVVAGVVLVTIVSFLFTALLVAVKLSGAPYTPGIFGVTNVDEASYTLFMCYQGVALLPLILAVGVLAPNSSDPARNDEDDRRRNPRWGSRSDPPSGGRPVAAVAATLVLVLVFSVGAAITVAEVPSYLDDHVQELANVTSGDVAALEWSGAHLPKCSRVLASPYSAAMFLPLYSPSQLVFGVAPLSVNLSYSIAVANLTLGAYTSQTRQALLNLGITEVFVTGRTSVSFPAFDPTPLLSSSDFSLLFQSQDAMIFAFGPGIADSGCAPV